MKPCVGNANIAVMAPRPDDPDGAEQLVERYAARVYQLALRIAGVKDDAEEIVEEALLAASHTVPSFEDESAFGSWIYRTVGRAAHQRFKRWQHIGAPVPDDVMPSLAADGHFQPMDDWSARIDEPAVQGELGVIVTAAIDALPADYRTALILNDVEGASKPAIADILEVDVPTVNSRVHRARLFVRKRLSEHFGSGKSARRNRVNRSPGMPHPTAEKDPGHQYPLKRTLPEGGKPMPTKVKPIPDGHHTVAPYLAIKNAASALDFYKTAFGATETYKLIIPDGRVGHAEIRLGDSLIMLSDEFPEFGGKAPESLGGSPVSIHLYVEDVDAVFKRALAAGARELKPVMDQFYGDRSGQLQDPFGHLWWVATHKEDVAPEEMQKRVRALFAKAT
jgi:PhnB protein